MDSCYVLPLYSALPLHNTCIAQYQCFPVDFKFNKGCFVQNNIPSSRDANSNHTKTKKGNINKQAGECNIFTHYFSQQYYILLAIKTFRLYFHFTNIPQIFFKKCYFLTSLLHNGTISYLHFVHKKLTYSHIFLETCSPLSILSMPTNLFFFLPPKGNHYLQIGVHLSHVCFSQFYCVFMYSV